jgi:hypothetical protein
MVIRVIPAFICLTTSQEDVECDVSEIQSLLVTVIIYR